MKKSAVWALLGACVVLLIAWFVPLPPIIAGEEALAAKTIPTDRSKAQAAAEQFHTAQERYQTYIKTHDLGALLVTAREGIAQAKAAPNDPGRLVAVNDAAAQVVDYAGVLQSYAQAGERYFNALLGYDDKLMSWTRSLGAESENLRSATFPFVEHLKVYPQPVGLKTDPHQVSAAQVGEQIASLTAHENVLNHYSDAQATGNGTVATLGAISKDISDIWESGRSIEYVAGLHDNYYRMLQTYDGQVQAAANDASSAGPTGGRFVLASALAVLVSALTLAGIAALLLPQPEASS